MKIITIALLQVLVLGVGYSQNSKPAQPIIQSGTNGRYQIVMNPEFARNTFLVDTQVGKVWRLTQFTDVKGEPTGWVVMARLDTDQDVFAWALRQGFKPETQK
ncbi:MAG TPA: hypothetical protein VMH05_10150 [Bryobacteraceae bacterium]|nr:hypothetical protein [Bryobacteraceae bacterium]